MINTEHSLVAQLRVLARTIEQWEEHVDKHLFTATPERIANWQIGIQSDLESALVKIEEHFKAMTR